MHILCTWCMRSIDICHLYSVMSQLMSQLMSQRWCAVKCGEFNLDLMTRTFLIHANDSLNKWNWRWKNSIFLNFYFQFFFFLMQFLPFFIVFAFPLFHSIPFNKLCIKSKQYTDSNEIGPVKIVFNFGINSRTK